MRFSAILRRTPRTIHTNRTERNHFFSTPSQKLYERGRGGGGGGALLSTLNFSSHSKNSDSDTNHLLSVLESEIRCAEEELEEHKQLNEIPFGFPFEIEDEPGKKFITVRSQYQGEDIKLMVKIPELFPVGNDDDDEKIDGDIQTDDQATVTMAGRVNKGADKPSLVIGCVAYPDEITIECMKVEKPNNIVNENAHFGPIFSSLDENLQKAFSKYLEDRGIRPSNTNFLYEYLIKKDSKEYLMWLKNLKRFIQT